MSKLYIACIADATASRLLPPRQRARLQAALRAALPELNRRYRRARSRRPVLPRGARRDGPRQAAAARVRVRRLPSALRRRARAPHELLLGAVLELDPPAAARRHAAAPRFARYRRRAAPRGPQRDLPPRPPHGLASRGGGG